MGEEEDSEDGRKLLVPAVRVARRAGRRAGRRAAYYYHRKLPSFVGDEAGSEEDHGGDRRLMYPSAYRYDADYNSRKLLVPAVRVARRAGRRAGRRAAYYYH